MTGHDREEEGTKPTLEPAIAMRLVLVSLTVSCKMPAMSALKQEKKRQFPHVASVFIHFQGVTLHLYIQMAPGNSLNQTNEEMETCLRTY